MPKALVNDTVIAATDTFESVEGNVYFPRSSVNFDLLERSDHTTYCGWKGTANYYHVVVDGKRLENAAWTYESPKPKAADIKDHLAFWRGVQVKH